MVTTACQPCYSPTMRKYAPAAILVLGALGALVLLRPQDAVAPSPTTTAVPVQVPSPVSAAPAYTALTVSTSQAPGYNRALFGSAWADLDHNGCNQREDTIMRDTGAARVERKGVCRADMTGHPYVDPYTGVTLTAPSQIQIDHVVSLGDAWRSGAASWTPQQRHAYANDFDVLWAVQGKANEEKSDKTPDEWLPPDPARRCDFERRYVAIKIKYHLTITPATRAALDTLVAMCGS